jgi:hypothetical protein
MRINRLRMLSTLAAATVTMTICATATPAGAATQTAHQRYVPLAGNPKYLVYAAADSVKPLYPGFLNQYVDLYVLRRTGKPMSLGEAGPEAGASLVNSNLIVTNPQDGKTLIRWWNLADRTHGHFETATGVVGATPDGWAYEIEESGLHVVSQSYAGVRVDLGDPLPGGVGYSVTTGPAGFVATADNDEDGNGQITYTPWGHPHETRTLLAPGDTENGCSSVTTTYAACWLFGRPKSPFALFPLDGGKPTVKAGACSHEYTVLGGRLAWVAEPSTANSLCHGSPVSELSATGAVIHSPRNFDDIALVSALGRLVVATSGQRSLVALTDAGATPVALTQ